MKEKVVLAYSCGLDTSIKKISLKELNSICSDIEEDIFDYIDYEKSIKMGIKKLL